MIDDSILRHIESYAHGRMNFIAGICRKLNVANLVDSMIHQPTTGRPCQIPYGILAEMMIIAICDDHQPLYLMEEFFADKDIEGIFQREIDKDKLTDDRFGLLLDYIHEFGAKKLFSLISAEAFATYQIQITNINYDTTSKVMWGEYHGVDGEVGTVEIEFGHSKQKRPYKKQIKMDIGTANGIVVDADVLNGNQDDKTWNGKKDRSSPPRVRSLRC